jgi:multicomponent Na+:H+ antiporter subunit A
MDTPLQEGGLFAPEPFDSMKQPAPVHPGMENVMLLVLTILSGFIVALVAPALGARLRGATGWVLALLPAVLTAYFVSLLPEAAAGEPLARSYPWVSDLGVLISLRTDGLNLRFTLLVSGVRTLMVCYAGGYLKGQPHLGRFYTPLLFDLGV